MAMFMNRRRLLVELTSAAVFLAFFTHHASAQATAEKKPYIYKTVDKLEIQADVYCSKADRLRPTLIWIHGGALILGDRRGIDDTFRDPLVAAGFAVVSIDYRLAPETKLAAILEDVQDACKWVRDKGPKLFQADPARIGRLLGFQRHHGRLGQQAQCPLSPAADNQRGGPESGWYEAADYSGGREQPRPLFSLLPAAGSVAARGRWTGSRQGRQSVRSLLSDPQRDGAVSPDAADSRYQGRGRSLRAIRRHGSGADEASRGTRADHGARSRPRSS